MQVTNKKEEDDTKNEDSLEEQVKGIKDESVNPEIKIIDNEKRYRTG